MWIDSKLEIPVFFSFDTSYVIFHWESSSDSFWRRKNVWRPLWNNCDNTAALRAEWTGLPLEQRAPRTTQTHSSCGLSYGAEWFLFWRCLRAVFCISEEAQVFFEQTFVFFFLVRCLIYVHWMILDEIIYSVISMMVCYSSFFRCCSFADAARFHTVRVVAKMHTVIWNAFVKQRSKQDELRLSFVSFWHPTVVKFLLMFWSLLSVTSWASLRHQECLISSLRWSPYRLLHRQTRMKIKDYMCLSGWTAQIDETKHETDWLVSFRTKTDRATPGHRANLFVWTSELTKNNFEVLVQVGEDCLVQWVHKFSPMSIESTERSSFQMQIGLDIQKATKPKKRHCFF